MIRVELSEFGCLLKAVVQQLVDYPEEVFLHEIVGEQVTIFEINARKSDHGKVVGRRGELVDALRHVAHCRGGRDARSYQIEVIDVPTVPTPRLSPNSPWNKPSTSVSATTALLVRIVQSLVDEVDRVDVTPLEGSQTAVFEVTVAPPDVSKVLGRHGKTADALRRLLSSMGTRAQRRYILCVMEP